jgi:hypothetical protein
MTNAADRLTPATPEDLADTLALPITSALLVTV